jgi:plasmid stabilization system protein ParE
VEAFQQVKIVWSPLAIERAYEAAAYIAGDKPEAALRWLDGLFSVTDRLEMFPESGRIVPEIGLPEFREVVYRKAYRVIYRLEKAEVSILTVRNFAQLIDVAELNTDAEPAG